MRLHCSVFVLLASIALISPATGQSFTFLVSEISGCAESNCAIGDEFTIGVRISNDGGLDGVPDDIAALAGSFFGYSPGVVEFVGGSAVSSVLHTACIGGVGCFQGIPNGIGPALTETGGFVRFFSGATSTTGHTIDGQQDPGLDGTIGGGDAQFEATFRVVGFGETTIQVGSNSAQNETVISRETNSPLLDVTNGSVRIALIPEPGSAVLIGTGLFGLGLRRHRPARSRRV